MFYVPNQLDKKWSVVCQMPRRGKPTQRSEDAIEYPSLITEFPSADNINSIDDDAAMYACDNNEGIWLDLEYCFYVCLQVEFVEWEKMIYVKVNIKRILCYLLLFYF